jgi:Holliday junction resolvase RusA-like endonuclease
MTTLSIEGVPLVSFKFDYIPSQNEHERAERVGSRRDKRWHTNMWRGLGEKIALEMYKAHRHLPLPLIRKRALVVIKVYRATEGKYDIHNPYVKALLDGFSDAGIWPDDEWAYVPIVTFMWAYMPKDDPEGQRFVIEVHELDRLVLNGVSQVLPSGRKVRAKPKK